MYKSAFYISLLAAFALLGVLGVAAKVCYALGLMGVFK